MQRSDCAAVFFRECKSLPRSTFSGKETSISHWRPPPPNRPVRSNLTMPQRRQQRRIIGPKEIARRKNIKKRMSSMSRKIRQLKDRYGIEAVLLWKESKAEHWQRVDDDDSEVNYIDPPSNFKTNRFKPGKRGGRLQ